MNNFMKTLKENWTSISLTTLFLTAIVFAVSAFLTPKYESQMSVLVIQKQPEDKVDAYSAAKSAEYLSDIFSKIIYTDSFIDEVLKSPAGIQRKFSSDREERKKEWERDVKTKKINNTGIIKISVFDPSRKEAEKIVQAISENLSANSAKYHGGGERVVISTIDGPITSKNQARPNVFLNSLLALIIGAVGSFGFFYFFRSEESGSIYLVKKPQTFSARERESIPTEPKNESRELSSFPEREEFSFPPAEE